MHAYRVEAVRLWLVPAEPQDESSSTPRGSGSGGKPSDQSRRPAVILPSDPVQMDTDLFMDLDRDLSFPLYSFIGSGAFGQVAHGQLGCMRCVMNTLRLTSQVTLCLTAISPAI